jgi:hypothetical protein
MLFVQKQLRFVDPLTLWHDTAPDAKKVSSSPVDSRAGSCAQALESGGVLTFFVIFRPDRFVSTMASAIPVIASSSELWVFFPLSYYTAFFVFGPRGRLRLTTSSILSSGHVEPHWLPVCCRAWYGGSHTPYWINFSFLQLQGHLSAHLR